jgi:hypothetical protein
VRNTIGSERRVQNSCGRQTDTGEIFISTGKPRVTSNDNFAIALHAHARLCACWFAELAGSNGKLVIDASFPASPKLNILKLRHRLPAF